MKNDSHDAIEKLVFWTLQWPPKLHIFVLALTMLWTYPVKNKNELLF